jgi:hypothetical protein
MEHVDWLHPDHIILSNSSTSSDYKNFTDDMRSNNFSRLRMLKIKNDLFIRYVINSDKKWYGCSILQQRGKDYYIFINSKIQDLELEKSYIKFNREDNLNEILNK